MDNWRQAFLREDEIDNSGGRRGVVKLLSYLKYDDSGEQAFLQGGTDLTSPETEKETVNLASYLKSCGIGTQDLHESGRHSEYEWEEVMLAGSK
jgi:hypothetical protein